MKHLRLTMILAGASQFVIADAFGASSGNTVILWNANADMAATTHGPTNEAFREEIMQRRELLATSGAMVSLAMFSGQAFAQSATGGKIIPWTDQPPPVPPPAAN